MLSITHLSVFFPRHTPSPSSLLFSLLDSISPFLVPSPKGILFIPPFHSLKRVMSYRTDNVASYDRTLLSSVPDPTRAEKQVRGPDQPFHPFSRNQQTEMSSRSSHVSFPFPTPYHLLFSNLSSTRPSPAPPTVSMRVSMWCSIGRVQCRPARRQPRAPRTVTHK